MKKITINSKEYTLKYSFKAAEFRDCVQRMFWMMSGSYMYKRLDETDENRERAGKYAMLDGSADMMAEIPHICISAFHAGMLEEQDGITEEESKALMQQYMIENKLSYFKLYEELKEVMEEDGFFALSGLSDMMEAMNTEVEQATEKAKKIPQNHKKKSTSTK